MCPFARIKARIMIGDNMDQLDRDLLGLLRVDARTSRILPPRARQAPLELPAIRESSTAKTPR
jgi:hypothetical protein